jgi:hypothetical protein
LIDGGREGLIDVLIYVLIDRKKEKGMERWKERSEVVMELYEQPL